MPTTYEAAPQEVKDMLADVMKRYHPKLAEVGARVGVIIARNYEGVPVKHGGYPAAANIKVVSLKDRVEKQYEAEMLIDGHWWDESRKEHRVALLDHELSHIEPVEDEEEGGWKMDDLGRPKLKSVLGDWNGGDGFKAVVERHKDFSVEVANFVKVEAKITAAKAGLPFPEDEEEGE